MRLPVEHAQVEREHQEHADVEGYEEPEPAHLRLVS
jgi:hypothetical protein